MQVNISPKEEKKQKCYDLIIGDQNFWDMLSDEAKEYAEDKIFGDDEYE